MLSNISISIALFLATALFDLTSAGLLHPHSGRWSSLARRADSDETDHSDIKKWAALGDSFAAGIGAGTRLTDWGSWYCSRYDDSYPSVINRSPSLGSSDGRDFKYYACSGAITTDVKNSQIPGLSGLQMATLSVGGNDANLKEILHACIYQWNKDPTLDCDKTLDESQKTIDSPQFSKNLDDVLNALKGAMASSDAKIYWTGYSHFWDASTNACDSVTWAFKYNIIHRQYLTQARRTVMNNLVDAVNQKIQDAIQRFGEQAIFVPWGPDVDYIGGHYCEPDVDESNAIDREQTAFYEWGTTKDDDLGDDKHDELRKRQEPGKLQAGQDLKNTWEGAISGWVTEAIQDGAKPEDFGLNQDDVVQAQSGLLLPDKYGRVFHPTRFAHMMIAENVLRTMDLTKAKSKGKKAATTTIVGCPSPTGPASHVGEGSSCNVDSPSDEVKFKIDDAYKVINDYCIKHQGDTVRSGPDGILEKYQNGDDQGSSLILMASLDTEPVCENYPNLGRLNFFDCFGRFSNAMNDCDTNTTTEKLGGHKVADCIFYSIRAIEGGTDPVSSDQPPPPRTCSMHVIQKGFYPKGSEGPFFNSDTPLDYTVEVTIYDGLNDDKKVIGHHDEADAGDKNPLSVSIDGLDIVLVITPEKRNDYIQFMLGSQGWKSSDKNSCSVGGWDPREQFPATRQMDCSFQC